MVGLCLGIGWNRVRRHFHDGLAETISLFTLGNLIVSCVAYWDKGFRMFLMSKKKKKKRVVMGLVVYSILNVKMLCLVQPDQSAPSLSCH